MLDAIERTDSASLGTWKSQVCLTGASGGIGQSLLASLVEHFSVKALFRQETETSRDWANKGCHIVLGDLEDKDALRELVRDAQTVFHCAAKVMGLSSSAFDAVNVQGTQNLVEAAVAAECSRVVHLSSNAVYWAGKASIDGEYCEDAVLEVDESMDSYSRSKLLAESVIISACEGSQTDYTILRPTGVYGPHIRSWTLIPLKMIRKGRPLFIGIDEAEGLLDPIYIDDLVQAILEAAKSPRAAGEILNIGSESIPFQEFYGYLGEMVGKPIRLGTKGKLKNLAAITRCFSCCSKVAVEMNKGVEMALRMSLNRCSYPSKKALELIGFTPRNTLPVGMLKTELWLRDNMILPRVQHKISNADGHYHLRPAAVIHPFTEIEIVNAVREASRNRFRVKAIGALHSFVPIPDTDGICVVLDRYNRLLTVEGTSVTVQAGITIAELSNQLADYQLALPNHGSHAAQTIAGALATSTHGGSIHHGTLADLVESLSLVRADGEVVEVRSGDSLFNGVVVSLGLLGVVSTVTLRCVPEFYLESRVRILAFEEFLSEFDAIQSQNDYVDMRYHPQIGKAEVLEMNRVECAAATVGVSSSVPGTKTRQKLVSFVFKVMLKILNATRSQSMNASLLKRMMGKSYRSGIMRCGEALAFSDLSEGEPFPIDDLEFAVAFTHAKAALRDLAAYYERSENYPRFFPVHLRCSKAGEHWLSPNQGQDVCWFEFWQYPPFPRLYHELNDVLAPYQYRIHWGKCQVAETEYLRRQYARWNDFVRLRREWDPHGQFLNTYSEKWFGEV